MQKSTTSSRFWGCISRRSTTLRRSCGLYDTVAWWSWPIRIRTGPTSRGCWSTLSTISGPTSCGTILLRSSSHPLSRWDVLSKWKEQLGWVCFSLLFKFISTVMIMPACKSEKLVWFVSVKEKTNYSVQSKCVLSGINFGLRQGLKLVSCFVCRFPREKLSTLSSVCLSLRSGNAAQRTGTHGKSSTTKVLLFCLLSYIFRGLPLGCHLIWVNCDETYVCL